MEHSIEQGWHPPPLVVSHHDGKYFLEDGNHRYETLRRTGATDAWIILLFAGEVERDRWLNEHGGEATGGPGEMTPTKTQVAPREDLT